VTRGNIILNNIKPLDAANVWDVIGLPRLLGSLHRLVEKVGVTDGPTRSKPGSHCHILLLQLSSLGCTMGFSTFWQLDPVSTGISIANNE
jgi:hypothetical protein